MKIKYFIIFIVIINEFIFSLKIVKNAKDDKNPFAEMSDADLSKMIKEYGLETKDLGILSQGVKDEENYQNKKSKRTKSRNSKDLLVDLNEEEDPLKSLLDEKLNIKEIHRKNNEILKKFDLNKKDVFTIINNLSKFQIFNKLPVTAMNLIQELTQNKKFKEIEKVYQNKTDDSHFLISSTLSSNVFMDHDNKLGRKGMLTLIDKNSAEVKNVWAVLNDKVFCFYNSSNYLNIQKLFRMSLIKIKDFLYSPCFFIYYDHDKENKIDFNHTENLICAINYREKEYWIRTLIYYKEYYENKFKNNFK